MKSQTLLLVDDEAAPAIVSKKELMKYGYTVLIARNGQQAINLALNGEKIDLILMDIELGEDMDGAETARRIHDSADIPIIFLSCHTEPEYVDRTLSIAHYGYIVKQTASTVLDTMIRSAISRHNHHQSVQIAMQDHQNGFRFIERFYRELFDEHLGGYWEWDFLSRQIALSPRLKQRLGFDGERAYGGSWDWNNLVLIESPGKFDDRIRRHADFGDVRFQAMSVQLRNADDSIHIGSGFCLLNSRTNEGGPDRVICGLADIAPFQAHHQSPSTIDHIVEVLPVPILVLTSQKHVLAMNDAFRELLGPGCGNLPHQSRDLYPDSAVGNAVFLDMVDKALEGNAGRCSLIGENPKREPFKVDMQFVPLIDENHDVDGVVVFQAGYREKPDVLIDTSESLSRSSNLHAHISHGILIHDSLGRMTFANPAAANLIGTLVDDDSTVHELFGLDWYRYDDDGPEAAAVEYPGLTALRTGEISTSARVRVHSSTTHKELWLLVDALPILREDGGGSTDQVMVILTDVTEFREDEMRLRSQIEQKDRMIREIHHRIKNNLYALGGFINIRASETENEYARTVLLTTTTHLNRLKTLYELVYQNEISGYISVRDYIGRLVREIVETFPLVIDTDLRVQEVDLKVGVAENLGIIVNELLTNSVKFAFSMYRENRFRLDMQFFDNRVRIVASDNGPGYDIESISTGLGTELIMAIIAHKNERFITRSHGGAFCEIEFDLE